MRAGRIAGPGLNKGCAVHVPAKQAAERLGRRGQDQG